MKAIAFILSIYVVFLSTTPVLISLNVLPADIVCEGNCSMEKTTDNHDDKQGCDKICNPFLPNNCFQDFTFLSFLFPLNDFSLPRTKNNNYKTLMSTQCISSIWNPPRV
jgi:hypothetical protein